MRQTYRVATSKRLGYRLDAEVFKGKDSEFENECGITVVIVSRSIGPKGIHMEVGVFANAEREWSKPLKVRSCAVYLKSFLDPNLGSN